MKISVPLQPMAQFSWTWTALGVLCLAAGVVLIFCWIRRHPPVPERRGEKPYRTELGRLSEVQTRYLLALDRLESEWRQTGEKDKREIHLRISGLVRDFVFESTGVETMHQTLSEIRRIDPERLGGSANLVRLEDVVRRCYGPEFAPRSRVETLVTFTKTRRMISRWN